MTFAYKGLSSSPMDRVRALRMSGELKGSTISGWLIGDLVDYGKSALLLNSSKEAHTAVLKLFDPELIDRYGAEVQKERVERERSLITKHHPHLVRILDAGEDAGY